MFGAEEVDKHIKIAEKNRTKQIGFMLIFTSKSRGAQLCAFAVVAGLCQAWSMGLPFHLGANGALQWAAMLILAWVTLRCRSSKENACVAFVFQSTALAVTFWWIFISLYVYGEMNGLLAAFAVVLLASALAMYWVALSWAFFKLSWEAKDPSERRSSQGLEKCRVALLFGLTWLLSELCRGQWFTGFPWGASGYAHNDTWMGLLAPWVGVYGIGALSAMLAMWVAQRCVEQWPTKERLLLRGRDRQKWAVLIMPILMLLSLSTWPLFKAVDLATLGAPGSLAQEGDSKALRVELLQGNVPQQTKFRNDRFSAAQWYYDQIVGSNAQLVVTPETAFAMTIDELPKAFNASIKHHLLAEQQAVLLGMPSKDDGQYANSAIGLVGERAQEYRYDKVHLVPFGEFIPPFFKWFTDQMQMPLGFFKRGEAAQGNLQFLSQKIAPNICYEDLFGEELAARFIKPDESPSILVNMSNIAWFGDTVILDQHLEISRMRTLELRRPMIRATNSGVSAVIDHQGHVLVRAKAFTQEKVSAWVQGRFDAPTPYAWWASRWGLLPLWALGLGALGWAWIQRASRLKAG